MVGLKRKEIWGLIVLTLCAALIRGYLLSRTNEYYADSFMRALQSFEWSRKPVWIACAYWVPGSTYLGGVFNWLVGNPLYAVRIMSLIAGSLSVPLLYLSARSTFGIFPASLAAVSLSCLPLHCGLSASSLSEATYVFFLLLSILLIIKTAAVRTAESRGQSFRFCFVFTAAVIAFLTMIRNESWLFLPCWAIYYLAKTRRLKETLVLSASLAAFPLYWLISCQLQAGLALLSFNGCRAPYCKDIGPIAGFGLMAGQMCLYLGPLLLCLAAAGGLLRLTAIARKQCRKGTAASESGQPGTACGGPLPLSEAAIPEQLLWFSLTAICFLANLILAWKLGPMFAERYLLALIVLLLPLPAIALGRFLEFRGLAPDKREKKRFTYQILSILIIVNSTVLTFMIFKPLILVSTEKFKDLEALAVYLKDSGAASRPMLMTSLANRHDLLPLILSDNSFNFIVCKDFFTSQADLQKRIEKTPPELFITDVGDGTDLSYLLKAVEFHLEKEPLYKSGKLLVYRIIPGTLKAKTPIEKSLSVWGQAN